jgi:hypothetical protein
MTGEHIPNTVVAELIDGIGLSIDMPFNTLKLIDKVKASLLATPLARHRYNRRIVGPLAAQDTHNPLVSIHTIHGIFPSRVYSLAFK